MPVQEVGSLFAVEKSGKDDVEAQVFYPGAQGEVHESQTCMAFVSRGFAKHGFNVPPGFLQSVWANWFARNSVWIKRRFAERRLENVDSSVIQSVVLPRFIESEMLPCILSAISGMDMRQNTFMAENIGASNSVRASLALKAVRSVRQECEAMPGGKGAVAIVRLVHDIALADAAVSLNQEQPIAWIRSVQISGDLFAKTHADNFGRFVAMMLVRAIQEGDSVEADSEAWSDLARVWTNGGDFGNEIADWCYVSCVMDIKSMAEQERIPEYTVRCCLKKALEIINAANSDGFDAVMVYLDIWRECRNIVEAFISSAIADTRTHLLAMDDTLLDTLSEAAGCSLHDKKGIIADACVTL